ncbi:hypothetical protein SKAU_G00382950 [Synaphobranchus kaupii]|uniref:Uncharacterized protein n=1 Tax=Synaphobranchus kaupii TaxID=118154 RepID=A0A9Q1EE33_SYNKA|nr:hypothetical protein SKAU_G00382950 [Synaphobranchus kaupii]
MSGKDEGSCIEGWTGFNGHCFKYTGLKLRHTVCIMEDTWLQRALKMIMRFLRSSKAIMVIVPSHSGSDCQMSTRDGQPLTGSEELRKTATSSPAVNGAGGTPNGCEDCSPPGEFSNLKKEDERVEKGGGLRSHV